MKTFAPFCHLSMFGLEVSQTTLDQGGYYSSFIVCCEENFDQSALTKWVLNLHFYSYFSSEKWQPSFFFLVSSCPYSDLPVGLPCAFLWLEKLNSLDSLKIGCGKSIGVCGCVFLLCVVNRNESRGLFLSWLLAMLFLISSPSNPLPYEGSLLPLLTLCHRNRGSVAWQSKLWWSGVTLSGFGYKKVCKMSFSGVKNQCGCRIQICWIFVSMSNSFPMTLHHWYVPFCFFFFLKITNEN